MLRTVQRFGNRNNFLFYKQIGNTLKQPKWIIPTNLSFDDTSNNISSVKYASTYYKTILSSPHIPIEFLIGPNIQTPILHQTRYYSSASLVPNVVPSDSRKSRNKASKAMSEDEKKLNSALEKGGLPVIGIKDMDENLPKFSERLWLGTKRIPGWILQITTKTMKGLYIAITDPATAIQWLREVKQVIMKEIKHYWLGSKLLYADVSTSIRILRRVLQGHALSRREKNLLQRTVTDLLRLVPFSFFIIVPFMEFLLPFALKLFPNMLPSTFKDSYNKEEDMKKQLQMRLALAQFLQETIKDITKASRDAVGASPEKIATANEVLDFVERAQKGHILESGEIMKFASLFNDELMLDNIFRPQLVGMCRYMGLQPFGSDNFLRFQIRNKIRQLKKDDQDIIWEGLETLDKEELELACSERGMRSTGLTKAGYRRQMKQWLDLSINRNVPATLLIMSRALNITNMDTPEEAIVQSLASMDEEVITAVALEAATPSEENHELRVMKLESLRVQNELIAEEEKERAGSKKKKEVVASTSSDSEMLVDMQKEDVAKDISQPPVIEQLISEPILTDTTPVIEAEKGERELTPGQVRALETFAFKSSVEKERQALDNIKQLKSAMDVEGLLSAGRIGAKVRASKSADRMRQRLDSMISSIEKELETVDKTIGDRLNLLDKDSDGIITSHEIKHAIKEILQEYETEEDAEWFVSQLDEDKDGKVSMEELMQWVKKKRIEMIESTEQPQAKESTSEKKQEIN